MDKMLQFPTIEQIFPFLPALNEIISYIPNWLQLSIITILGGIMVTCFILGTLINRKLQNSYLEILKQKFRPYAEEFDISHEKKGYVHFHKKEALDEMEIIFVMQNRENMFHQLITRFSPEHDKVAFQAEAKVNHGFKLEILPRHDKKTIESIFEDLMALKKCVTQEEKFDKKFLVHSSDLVHGRLLLLDNKHLMNQMLKLEKDIKRISFDDKPPIFFTFFNILDKEFKKAPEFIDLILKLGEAYNGLRIRKARPKRPKKGKSVGRKI